MTQKFTIQREEYPNHFAGFNPQKYCQWTSCEGDALLVPVDDLAETLVRIKHTPYAKADKLSASLYDRKS